MNLPAEQINHYHYAGFWLRVAAALVDTIILWIPVSVFPWLASDMLKSPLLEVLDFAQLTLVWTIYYGVSESSRHQATFGKRVMGLRVIDLNGQGLSFARAATRYLFGIVAALPLGLGLFMVGWTSRKQGLHDKVMRCLVIKQPEPESVAA